MPLACLIPDWKAYIGTQLAEGTIVSVEDEGAVLALSPGIKCVFAREIRISSTTLAAGVAGRDNYCLRRCSGTVARYQNLDRQTMLQLIDIEQNSLFSFTCQSVGQEE